MADKGRSEKDFFGNGYTHYDSNGKKIGRSEPNIFGGGYTNYDAHGKKVAGPSKISSEADTRLMITKATKSEEWNIRFLALAIATTIRTAKRSAAAALNFLAQGTTTVMAVATLRPVFTAHMIAPKCGLSADSVIIPLQNQFLEEHLSEHIMLSVPQY